QSSARRPTLCSPAIGTRTVRAWVPTAPIRGCGALGMTHCRYCGFGAYAHIPCREGPRPPPISSCSPLGTFDCEHSCFHPDSGPERNVITQTPGDPYYENQVTARGLEEQLQCSKVRGIGGTNMYSCVTNARREKSLRTAQFLQQITYSADCSFFVKKVWRMSPSPVETCTVKCPEEALNVTHMATVQRAAREASRSSRKHRGSASRPAGAAREAGRSCLEPRDELAAVKRQSLVVESTEVLPAARQAPPRADTPGPEPRVAPKAAPRRRREGDRQQRQQNVVVQLLKPPSTGRGRLLMSLNLLIGLVLVSFSVVLMDVVRSPPSLLNPPPDQKVKK
ncbi:unnamed protein product, partial [Effrenium voratum]